MPEARNVSDKVRLANSPDPKYLQRWRIDPGVRQLPWPYRNYFTITSDCDGCNDSNVLSAITEIREWYQLPIRDSFFASWLFERYIESEGSTAQFEFLDRNREFLRAFHQGCFDTYHGFLVNMTAWIADDIELSAEQEGGTEEASRSFRIPDGWHGVRKPRYLYFEIWMPVAGSNFTLSFNYGENEVQVFSWDLSARSFLTERGCILDLNELGITKREELVSSSIRIEFIGPKGAPFALRNPTLLSHTRQDVEAFDQGLDDYNLRVSAFTSHGVGVTLGVAQMPNMEAVDNRGLNDIPENPHYFVDILSDGHVRFFNSFNNTTQYEVLPVEELVFVNEMADGAPFYDFSRYSYAPKNEEGFIDYTLWWSEERSVNPSLQDYIGIQVQGFLHSIESQPWKGGMLYTHLNVTNKEDSARSTPAVGSVLSEETNEALARLREEYLVRRSLFVAPTSILLRLGQIKSTIGSHYSYNKEANKVSVFSWLDPVSDEILPNRANCFRELRYLDFCVDAAATALFEVDSEPVNNLMRISAEEGEWIRVVDTSRGIASAPEHRKFQVTLHLYDNFRIVCEEPHDLRILLTGGDSEIEFNLSDFSQLGYSACPVTEPPGNVELYLPVSVLYTVAENAGVSYERCDVMAEFIGAEEVAFYQDWEGVSQNRVIISGSVPDDTDEVVLCIGDEEHVTLTDNGFYIFQDKVLWGACINIRANTVDGAEVVFPNSGSLKVFGDVCDLDGVKLDE